MESIQLHLGLNKIALSLERVFKALNHETPDRVPIDDAWMLYVRMDTWDTLKKIP
jgi:hypothetical protein